MLKYLCKIIIIICLLVISNSGITQYVTPSPLPLPTHIPTDEINIAEQVGYCLGIAGANSCTANDFTITSIETVNIDDGCSSPDDYMQIDMDVTFKKQQPTRYNLAGWFYRGPDATSGTSFNSQTAITGDFCSRIG